MKGVFIVVYLFDSPYTFIIIIFAYNCFIYLPKYIEAIYFNNHINEKRILSRMSDIVLLLSLVYIVIDSYKANPTSVLSIGLISMLVLFIAIVVVIRIRQYNLKTSNIYVRGIIYGIDGNKEAIVELKAKYEQININTSYSGVPKSITVKTDTKNEAIELFELINNETYLFKDISQIKYRQLLFIFIFMFGLSSIYLVFLGLYELGLII